MYGGLRVIGGHLREIQDEIRSIHRIDTLYGSLVLNLKAALLKYMVRLT
jgi:hypothetical protein